MTGKVRQGGASLPLGEFVTAQEPVWVWDVEARRILWANAAGQAFWGVSDLDGLRERRFDARSKAVRRMTSLAGKDSATRETTETLRFPGSAAAAPVPYTMQTMEIAGGRPGVIVKALGPPAKPAKRAARAGRAEPPRDEAALKAIAAQLQGAQAAKRSKRSIALELGGETAGRPPDFQNAVLEEFFHEMRNPLTVILGFAERIRDSDPVRARGKIKVYAETILEGAQLTLDIMSDFSERMTQKSADLAPVRRSDVRAAFESCLRLVAPLASQAGLKISKSLGRALPHLLADERALKQILLNLLINAVRHQKTGKRLRAKARLQRGGALLLSVEDDGIGMTKREIAAALSRKRRKADDGLSRSGFGLPLVRRLVEELGGSLAIVSARRKGTTVEIAFPPERLLARDGGDS